jgi:hypothetical protein
MERGSFKVQDGTIIRFWEDLWIGNEPLMKKYPSLYNIVREKMRQWLKYYSIKHLFYKSTCGGKLGQVVAVGGEYSYSVS